MTPEAVTESLKAQRAWMNPEPTARPAKWHHEYTRSIRAFRVFDPTGKSTHETTERKVAEIIVRIGNQALEAIKATKSLKAQRDEALTVLQSAREEYATLGSLETSAPIIDTLLAEYKFVTP